jgi:hypothetical protein
LVECCRDGCPSGRFSHLHRGTLELCQSDHWVLGHLPDQGPSTRLFSLAGRWALGRVNPVSNLYRQFIWPHGLVFALTCTVNCGTLYKQACAFPNHVQSIEFTTGGQQSSCRNMSRMINGNRMHLTSILSLIAKGLNTYVNKAVVIFANKSKKSVFALSLWHIVCRLRKKVIESILE